MKTDRGHSGSDSGRRWVILGVMYLCTLAFAFAMQSLPPVLTLIMGELELSHAQAGSLMSFFALPGIIVSIPMGLLSDRYNPKAIGAISLVLTIAGIALFASGDAFPVMALGRFVSGAGAITLVIVAPQLLAQWFVGREIGIAMGVFNTAMPLGSVLSLNFLSVLGGRLGWRASVWFSAGVALLALVVFLLFFAPAPKKGKPLSGPPEPLLEGLRLTGSSIWLVGAAWMLYNAATISMYTFTPGLLKANGFSIASAGFYTSLFLWPSLFLGPFVGGLFLSCQYQNGERSK